LLGNTDLTTTNVLRTIRWLLRWIRESVSAMAIMACRKDKPQPPARLREPGRGVQHVNDATNGELAVTGGSRGRRARLAGKATMMLLVSL